jgi:hypothetical protein
MKNRTLLTAALGSVLLTACGGGGDGSSGSMTLRLTDAPVDEATSVIVEFTGVELLRANGAPLLFTFEPRRIDLLALQGGDSTTLLNGVTVPAGDYRQIRLQVNAGRDASDSYITLDDGSMHALFIPSGNQSGLKLTGGFTVPEGGSADFTIDFDLRKSVTYPPGLGGAYILRPSLRLVETATAGEIAGTVGNALAAQSDCSAAVYVYAGEGVTPDDVGSPTEPVTSAQVSLDETTGEYRYTVGFVEPGAYTVAFTCDAASDAPTTDDDIAFEPPANVTVAAGETAVADFGL